MRHSVSGLNPKNKSGLHPQGLAVLLEPYEPEIKKSMIAMPPSVSDRATMVETRARVIELGPCAWEDEDEPRAKPGDLVMITAFAGRIVKGTLDGKEYRVCNDRDVFLTIEEKSDGR